MTSVKIYFMDGEIETYLTENHDTMDDVLTILVGEKTDSWIHFPLHTIKKILTEIL